MLLCVRGVILAAVFWGVLFHAACRGRAGGEQGEYRDFRNRRGRAIQARVLRVSGDEVTIERSDGQQFTVLISIFSQADQDYVRSLASSRTPDASGDDWPRFRGPGGLGVSDATGVPLEWDANNNIVWKTALAGPGASSPITYGDHVYVTCYSGYFVPDQPGGSLEQLKRHLIALRRESGEIIWDQATSAKLPEESRIRDHGYAANTPVADAERVYVFFGKSGVFAYDHNGRELWQADVGSKTSGWGTAASPILHENLVLINASVESESLVALDRRTGKPTWRAEGIVESWNTPILVPIGDRTELVVAIHGKVLGFDPNTGQPLWQCETGIGWYMVPSLLAHDGVVYCIGGREGGALAVRAGGRGDVTQSRRLWTIRKGSNVTSPIIHDGHLYWAHESLGIVFCASARTGEIVYEQRLERAGQIYASPVLVNGHLYYPARNGRTFVLTARPEFQQVAVNDLGDGSRFDASPAVAAGHLFIRSDKYLYCIGQR